MATRPKSELVRLLLVGALAGLTWACALRGWMAQLAGPDTTFDWLKTFVGVLAAGVAVGALLGWAEYLRRTGGRPGWRWLGASPALLPIIALAMPGVLMSVFTGQGTGAIGVAIVGVGGGYALGNVGALWTRIVVGVLTAALTAFLGLSGLFISPEFALTEPRGAWAWLLFVTLMLPLALATSIPFRRVVAGAPTGG